MSDARPPQAGNPVWAQLQSLQVEFAARLPARLDDIRALHERLGQTEWDLAGAEALHRQVHGITGAAGTFGMRSLSEAARELEDRLARLIRRGGPPGPVEWNTIAEGIERLQDLALSRPSVETGTALLSLVPSSPPSDVQVHLVVDDRVQANVLRSSLQDSGFKVCLHSSLAAFREHCSDRNPGAADAVVMDVAFPDDDPFGSVLLRGLQLGRHGRAPVVVALGDDALAARLAASRAGASRTLVRPLDPVRLVDTLNVLTGRLPQRPYRVLLVDDDPLLLQVQANVLRAAGMEVRSLSQPLRTLDELEAFGPDVLLLDVHMPEASGSELAAALRERDAHVHLPILFLSAETDLTQQLLALNLGGDDFLVKPVQSEHLVAAVTARARRARQAGALRERLQTTLYEREREHLALDHHAIVSIADRDGNITYANDLFCQVSGYHRRELLGMSHRLLTSDVHDSVFIRSIWRSIAGGKVWHGEICCQRKNGGSYWVESTITPFVDSAGQVYQYVVIQTDISHIKAAEARLRSQRDLQRCISEAAARLMAAPPSQTQTTIHEALRHSGEQLGVDRSYLFRFAGVGALDNTQVWCAPGVDPMDDRLKTTPVEATPWLREQFYRNDILVVPDVLALPPEAALDRARMQERQIRAFLAFPLKRDGQIFGFIGYSVMHQRRDWTADEIDLLKVLADVVASAVARKLAETALRESEARLNFLVSSSPVVIYTREAKSPHAVAYVSPNVKQLMGFDPHSFTRDQEQGLGFVHPEDRERVSLGLPLVMEQGVDLSEYRLDCPSGGHRWVQDHRRLVRDAEGRPLEIIGYWMDITERKRFEAELSAFNTELEQRVEAQTRDVLASERLAQGTLDALSARVVILDERGDIVAANRAWSGFFGGRTPASVGNYLRYCEQRDQASGRDAATHLAPGLRAVLRGVERSHMQEYGREADGEYHWYVCRIERFGTDDEPRVVVSHEDITALKQAERAQLRSQRLESLGTLAGGVAHDLNNALAPVLMGMSILKEQYPQESRLFDMIQGSAQRGADMVRQLLTFAKGAEGERVSVCPEQVLREIERLMKGSFPKNIQLLVHSDADLPAVLGDPTQLHQVLLNLCVNARDAMPGGGTLSVRAQAVELDAAYARAIPDAVPGRYLALRVSDTGAGIPPDILERIFDPFFTTKGADKGTGLGLSTVLGIVRGHNGFIQVYSQPGEGTTFSVYLPIAASTDDGQAPAAPTESAELVLGRGETVLFVDDEAAVREVGRTVLERLNYRPLVATDGADGLLKAVEHRDTLRAVVTDLHMPHMDGLAFVRALRRTLPSVPVLVASGRVDEVVAAELLHHGVTRRLDKPFTEIQLARALQKMVGA